MSCHVIVGAGQAGLQIAETLRREGFDGRVVLLGEETLAPYQRPPLSKKFLLGEVTAERLLFRAPAYYANQDIELRLATRVTAVDPVARHLTLEGGERLAWNKLALCTGARARSLALPGADDPRVCVLRSIEDAVALKARLEDAAQVVIVGAGFIGLEVAAIARKLGKTVSVLEAAPRVLARVVSPEVSRFFQALHEGHGVRLLLAEQVAALVPGATHLEVRTGAGERLAADLVVVGIGAAPNEALAAEAGLACDGGILVDEYAQTSHPDIVAAGDCTRHRNQRYPGPQRLESVQNAVDQGKVAALTLLGRPEPYAQVPWFWSDQYDVKLQMVGLSAGYDEVIVRGVPAAGGFSVFYRLGGRVIAADSINRPAEHMMARRLIAAGGVCDQNLLADPATDMKTLF